MRRVLGVIFIILVLILYLFSPKEKENFKINDTFVYNLNFKTVFFKKSISIAGNILLSAKLNIRILKKGVKSRYIALSLSKVNFILGNKILEKSLEKLYQNILVLHINNYGEILHIYSNEKEEDIKGLKQLYYMMQMSFNKKDSYMTVEYDTNGKYNAHYSKKDNTLYKERVEYINRENIEFKSSKIELSLNKKNIPKTFRLKEKLVTKNETLILFENENMLLLELTNENIDKNLLIAQKDLTIAKLLSSLATQKRRKKELWREIKEKTLKAKIKNNHITFESLASKGTLKDLRLYLSVQKEELFKVFDAINQGNESIDKKYIHLLSLIGSKEAQDFLLSIVQEEEMSQMNKIRAIIALGSVKKVNFDTVETLLNLRESTQQDKTLKDTTLLSLGSLSSSQKKEISIEIDDYLKEALKKEASKTVLFAMKNAGIEKFKEEVFIYAKEINKNKALSIKLLKEIPSKEVKVFLENELTVSDNDKVTASVIDALLPYPDSHKTVKYIKNNIKTTGDNKTRTQMIQYLIESANEENSNKILLKELLPMEHSKENIKLIIKAIR